MTEQVSASQLFNNIIGLNSNVIDIFDSEGGHKKVSFSKPHDPADQLQLNK